MAALAGQSNPATSVQEPGKYLHLLPSQWLEFCLDCSVSLPAAQHAHLTRQRGTDLVVQACQPIKWLGNVGISTPHRTRPQRQPLPESNLLLADPCPRAEPRCPLKCHHRAFHN